MTNAATVTGTTPSTSGREPVAPDLHLERHRVELTAYCYRMLGSAFEADDAAQETLVRAWRAMDRFEGRSSLRSWLYRIATNVCFDLLDGRRRRARPMGLGPAWSPDDHPGQELPEDRWVQPVPDGRVLPEGDPAEVAVARETVRLAFVAALQHLPPRQRAVLILREVLRWKAGEVAALLDTTVASVNSALQRARATLAASGVTPDGTTAEPAGERDQALLARYVDAFERYDMASLTALLHEDATLSMPPYALWLRGPADIAAWMVGHGAGCRGSRLVPVAANGSAAFGQYRDGGREPWALHVVEASGGRITAMIAFLDTASLFPLFGLPPRLEG